ncbi:hypothetical protein M0804_010473 [Polistes exclamans]|nr:hypothetical protein M0804_010473 [Polistes exclamans]
MAPQQEQTSRQGRHGATESRWMDLGSSDPPELSRQATVRVSSAGNRNEHPYKTGYYSKMLRNVTRQLFDSTFPDGNPNMDASGQD